MNDRAKQMALILGGAGFVGSQIATRFCRAGYNVIVIDGLMDQTGGRKKNLSPIISEIQFLDSCIEDVHDLAEIVRQSDIIVDCMAWTSHRLALLDPVYDLRLNAESHLYLIRQLQENRNKKVIYLGSRVQYGNPGVAEITENTPMVPEDVQGIHKLTAESYYRVYAKLNSLNVVSLRFPNCFGENQPVLGDDIGLIGSFIRDILDNKCIEVFGHDRKRHLVYVKDLAEVVFLLIKKPNVGFSAFNLGGYEVLIEDLVKTLIELTGQGTYQIKELSHEIRSIDVGNARFSEAKLKTLLGEIPRTDLRSALLATITYFKENMK